jgi:hypothetical protein
MQYIDESDPCWSGYEMIGMKKKGGRKVPNCVPINEADGYIKEAYATKTPEFIEMMQPGLNEAEYQGRKVQLGKPMRGDVRKYKVYVKNSKGRVVKVNFGDPNMEIKRDNPKRRKSFRARHKCSTAKDRTSARYWSCRMWSSTPVSKII